MLMYMFRKRKINNFILYITKKANPEDWLFEICYLNDYWIEFFEVCVTIALIIVFQSSKCIS